MLLGLKRISTAFGLLALGASFATAQAPSPAISQNQATANAVASALKSSRTLSAYRIEIESNNGVVTLAGAVPNATQKREALALVNKVRGVTGVVDQIRLVDARVRPAQYQMAMGHHGRQSAETISDGTPIESAPAMTAPDGSPVPEGPAGVGMGMGAGGAANAPNYAWPSYAPSGNFSAVGYPTAYPWQAWPNIGPFYPYPEVPQDWRAVTLPLGRRHLVARLQEELHPPVLHPLPLRPLRLLSRSGDEPFLEKHRGASRIRPGRPLGLSNTQVGSGSSAPSKRSESGRRNPGITSPPSRASSRPITRIERGESYSYTSDSWT